MPRSLRQEPCRDLCDWRPTGDVRDGDLVFACAGCTSEWVRSEGWTPRNLDGSIADAVTEGRVGIVGANYRLSEGTAVPHVTVGIES